MEHEYFTIIIIIINLSIIARRGLQFDGHRDGRSVNISQNVGRTELDPSRNSTLDKANSGTFGRRESLRRLHGSRFDREERFRICEKRGFQ